MAIPVYPVTRKLQRGATERESVGGFANHQHRAARVTHNRLGNASQNQGAATRVDGGYRLGGTWPVVTGVEDSEWTFLVGTLVEDGEPRLVDGRPDTRNFLVPTSELESLLIVSDGADDLLDLPLSEFWTRDSFFANSDALRRRLAVLNREVVTADWQRQRIERSGGRLTDDTTVIAIRRSAEEAS